MQKMENMLKYLKKNKKVKRKLNIKAFIILLLVLYLIGMLFYTFFTMPIKNIYIKNTNFLSDNEIIEVAGIKDYPSIFKLSSKKLEEKILSLELVEKVKVSKKLNGKLIIDIDEAVPLFYVRSTDKVVLSSKKHVNNNNKYLGIPALINKVPNDLLNKFIEAFKEVDLDILKMINEIEYKITNIYIIQKEDVYEYMDYSFIVESEDTLYHFTPYKDNPFNINTSDYALID